MPANARETGPNTAALAAAIRAQMGIQGLSRPALAKASGIPLGTLHKILKYGGAIDWEQLNKIAAALDMPAWKLAQNAAYLSQDQGGTGVDQSE